MNWKDCAASIYLEGVATYFSQKLVPGHKESVYFSYDEDGEEWLAYCKAHRSEIAQVFLKDMEEETEGMEKEWLRLSGGQRLRFNRLGYFLGTAFVQDLRGRFSESDVLLLLAQGDVSEEVERWLRSQWAS